MSLTKHYVKLKRITPVEVDNTYDVTVQDKHMLIANGFYTSNCWHPDIVEFITAKRQPGRLSKFNLSVNCTDDFMLLVDKITKLEKILADKKATGESTVEIENKIAEIDKWDLIFPDTTVPEYKTVWNGDLKLFCIRGLQ